MSFLKYFQCIGCTEFNFLRTNVQTFKAQMEKNCYKKSIKKYASNLFDCTAQIYIELIYIDFQTNKMKKSFQIKLKRMKIN